MSVAHAELAVSNICWGDGPEVHAEAINILGEYGVTAIDVAPSKAFPTVGTEEGPGKVTIDEIEAFRSTLRPEDSSQRLRIAGFQSLTFGRTESIFSELAEDSAALQQHVAGIIRLAGAVGAQTVVYGSGGTRLTGELNESQIRERAEAFFVPLGETALNAGVTLGIEPVSTTWTKGADVFGRSGIEVVDFATSLQRHHGVRSVKLVPDSFAMADSGEEIVSTIMSADTHGVLATHAQIAEPGMIAHSPESTIDRAHTSLDAALYGHWRKHQDATPLPTLAIEMFPLKDEHGPLTGRELRAALGDVILTARDSYMATLTPLRAENIL